MAKKIANNDIDKLAYSLVCEETNNLIFIFGNNNSEKIRLKNLIESYINQNSNKKVLSITSALFIDDCFNNDDLDLYSNKYGDVDVFIIDDIQLLKISSLVREKFFNIFNNLYSKNKQIIILSDRHPEDLDKFEDRLVTRFCWGKIVNLNNLIMKGVIL